MKRYAMKADISQAPIVDALRSLGDKVDIIGRPVDLLIRTHSLYWTAECKTPGKNQKRRQEVQKAHADDANAHHSPHFVLTSVDDALSCRNTVVDRLGNMT